jgi:NitT/TauT family transport system substrate-binding protein
VGRAGFTPKVFHRRTTLIGGLSLISKVRAAERPVIRLGLVQFGTVQWLADVVHRHALDAAHGFTLATEPLANTDAGRVAILAAGADIVVLDWLFVAVQRAKGSLLQFAPLSSASGGIVVRRDSAIHGLADLTGKRLGVAGGPMDKSWLIVQATARRTAGIELITSAKIDYGAPPLLGAKLQQGELDAVLTFWNFAATLEAEGCVQILSVANCAAALGLAPHLDLIGFVFRENWANGMPIAVNGFLSAVTEAAHILATTPAEWDAIRPLMRAPSDALFVQLRDRFIAGVTTLPDVATQEREATALFRILNETGGMSATGGLESLPSGFFWHSFHEPD